ncbi:hypothetical protein K2173_015355 [Erythroxylum novogranatense]|uniref:Protein phosphatase n=1 Tax=Erythroxylum novogranatense TaxID=1862640 RepID=A0AAV8SRI6_9ROSI|nr:hypothetical protein K2173_015355 [Erythroxylum novogranatense]
MDGLSLNSVIAARHRHRPLNFSSSFSSSSYHHTFFFFSSTRFFSSFLPLVSSLGRSSSITFCSSHNDANSTTQYHLLSTTELPDGSFVFRFGDVGELEHEAEVHHLDKSSVAHSDASQQIISSSNAVMNETSSAEETEFLDNPPAFATSEVITYKILTLPPQSRIDSDVAQKQATCGDNHIVVASSDGDSGLDVVFSEDKVAPQASQLITTDSGLSDDSFASRNATYKESTNAQVTHLDQSREEQSNVPTDATQKVGDVGSSVMDEGIIDEHPNCTAENASVDNNGIENSKMLDHCLSSLNLEEEMSEGDLLYSSNMDLSCETEGSALKGDRDIILTTGLFLTSGAVVIPHPSKALTGVEDTYFVHQNWLGIADGVGEWSFEGTNTGLYAHNLIKRCVDILLDSKCAPDPVEVLDKAVALTQCPGSCTALIAYFDGEALQVDNIGDSGFLIIRNSTVYKRSSAMVHEFNFPLRIERGDDPCQLSENIIQALTPPSLLIQLFKTRRGENRSKLLCMYRHSLINSLCSESTVAIECCSSLQLGTFYRYKIDLDEGDIIITATKGLFDNLYEQEICSIVSLSLQAGLRLQEVAELLAARAQEIGKSATARTPFADIAQAAGYVGYTGGKLDDVTVIVSLLQKQNKSVSNLLF